MLPRLPEDFASYKGLEVSDKAVAATFAFGFCFSPFPLRFFCGLKLIFATFQLAIWTTTPWTIPANRAGHQGNS